MSMSWALAVAIYAMSFVVIHGASIPHSSTLLDIVFLLQKRNHTPPSPVLRSLSLPLRHPLATHLASIFLARNQIPLIDPLNLQSRLHCRLEKACDNRPSSMKSSHDPDTPARGKEPAHRAREVLVLRAHPVAVCCDDAIEAGLVLHGPGIGL